MEPTTTPQDSAATDDSSETRGVIAWRQRQLERAGFSSQLARELACACAVDLHQLIELVERGCPPPLAARILAPLDGQQRCC